MNNFALEAKLKAIPVPERSEEYWDDFPSRVRMQLSRLARLEPARCPRRAPWQWNGGLALACVLLCLSLLPVFHAALKDERLMRREATQLPHKMFVFMADEHGMQNLITDSD